MNYRVTITVDVHAGSREEAERVARKAIVSDLVGWDSGVIDVRTEVVDSAQNGEAGP